MTLNYLHDFMLTQPPGAEIGSLPRIRSEAINSPGHTHHPATPDNPFVEDEGHMLPSIVPNDFQFGHRLLQIKFRF